MPRDVAPRLFASVLCPVDFSANSRAALRYAAMLARISDAHLIVVHVVDPLLAVAAESRQDAQQVLADTENDLRRFVTGVTRADRPGIAVTLLTLRGKPAQEIVNAADRHGCDVIVIGYRGAGRTSRLLFGSTTEAVVRASHVPVLAIPPRRRRARLPVEGSRLRRAS